MPYVVSNIPVHKEVTLNGKGGFLIDPDNPEDLAEKIRLLLKDKKLYEKKSRDAQALAKKYDWEKIAMETEKVFKSLT